MGRFPGQSPTSFRLHLDSAQQVRKRLPGQQIHRSPTVVTLGERQRGVKSRAHDAHAHSADEDGRAVEAGGHDGRTGTGRAEDICRGDGDLGVADVGTGAGCMAGGGDMADDLEGVGVVGLDVCAGDEEDHD